MKEPQTHGFTTGLQTFFLIEGAKKVRARDCKPMEITPDYQYQNFT
jgi:hypothetical protein